MKHWLYTHLLAPVMTMVRPRSPSVRHMDNRSANSCKCSSSGTVMAVPVLGDWAEEDDVAADAVAAVVGDTTSFSVSLDGGENEALAGTDSSDMVESK